MVPNKSLFFYLVGISVLVTYALILFISYDQIPDTIVTHINLTGSGDKTYGHKSALWIATFVNMGLLVLMGFSLKYPQIINYPRPSDKKELKKLEENLKIFVGVSSIIISMVFSSMIFYAVKMDWKLLIFLFITVVILPIIVYFKIIPRK